MFLMAMFRIIINISLSSPYLLSVQVTFHCIKYPNTKLFLVRILLYSDQCFHAVFINTVSLIKSFPPTAVAFQAFLS